MGRKPSEVFLELWQWRALDLKPEEFSECAEAWRQIVSLEEIYAAAQAKDLANRLAMEPVQLVPAPMQMMDIPEPREVTYDCASAPMPEPAAAAAGVSKSDAGKAAMVTRKRRALERLDALRARSVSMADVAAAGPGLTLSDVLDAVARRPLPLPKLVALEKALNKLEEAATNGGETA